MSGNGKKKMNKRMVTLLIGLAAILLLCGALVLLLQNDGGEDASSIPDSSDAKYLVTDKSAEDVKSIVVTNPTGTYTVAKRGEDYVVESYLAENGETVSVPGDVLFASTAIESFADSIFTATITETLEGAADNLALYGLQNPQISVAVSYTDGTGFAFDIGSEAPDATSYYVYNPAAKEVGLIAKSSLSRAGNAKETYVEKTLVPTPGEDEVYADTVVLGGSVRPEEIVLEAVYTQDEETNAAIMGGYRVTAPKNKDVDVNNTAFLAEGLWGAQAAAAVTIAPTEEQLAEAGLAEPYSTLHLTYAGKTLELKLGNKNADGKYYCTTTENNAIFLVGADVVPWAEYTAFNMYYKLVQVPHIATVSALTVEFDGKAYRFDLTHGEESELTVSSGGKDVPDEAFRSFYQLIISAKGEYEAGEIAEGAQSQMKFTYEFADRQTPDSVVEFFPLTDRRSAIVADGDLTFAVRSLYVDKVKASIDSVLAGEKVVISW